MPRPRTSFSSPPWKGGKAGFHTQLTEDMSLQTLRLPQVGTAPLVTATHL